MRKAAVLVEVGEGDLRVPGPDEYSDALREAVYALTQLIPPGCVVSYSDIAGVLGLSPRVVALILRSNERPVAIPCHRIVLSNGSLGGYTLRGRPNPSFKRALLALEGTVFRDEGRVGRESLECGRRVLESLLKR